jgi:acylphosphatase
MELHEAKALDQGNEKVTEIAHRLAVEGGGLISIYYHPCEFVHQQFWDGVNFRRGANPPREEWKAPPQLTAEQTEQAFLRFEKYIDHIKSLGVRFVTASELPAIYADRVRSEGLTETELVGLAKRLTDPKTAGVNYQVLEGKAVSPADQLELLSMAMGDLIDGKTVKYPLAARGVLGPDSAPGSAGEGGQMIAWPAFRDAAMDVRDYLRAHGRVPARVFIGADCVTPADFLGALAFAYQFEWEHGKLPLDGVRLGKGLAVLTERHVAKDPAGLFDWDIHKPGFRPAKILEVARLQAWTLKPAVRCTQQAAAEGSVRRVHAIVSGRVQGVGFRAFTQEQATNLGLTGYVLNREDGSVEATIEGPTEKVKRLLELMKRGPEAARVDGLRVTDQSPKGEFKEFEIRYEASRDATGTTQ